MNLYVIFDKLAQESGPIWEAKNDDVALRKWKQEQANAQFNTDEYQLFCVGTFDHETNVLEPTEFPIEIFEHLSTPKERENAASIS